MAYPVALFKRMVLNAPLKQRWEYYTGNIADDSAHSPSLTHVRMLAHGLYLMGKAELAQKVERQVLVDEEKKVHEYVHTHYFITIRERIHPSDFDVARKLHLESTS